MNAVELMLEQINKSLEQLEKREVADHREELSMLRSEISASKRLLSDVSEILAKSDYRRLEAKLDSLGAGVHELDRSVRNYSWLFPDLRAWFTSFWQGRAAVVFGVLFVVSVLAGIYLYTQYAHYRAASNLYQGGWYKYERTKLDNPKGEGYFSDLDQLYAADQEKFVYEIDSVLYEREQEVARTRRIKALKDSLEQLENYEKTLR